MSGGLTNSKIGVRAAIFCLTFLLQVTAAQAQLKSGSCNDYGGTLGKSTKIGMSLYAQDQKLQGAYFYKAHLADIPLSGVYTSVRDISLTETESGGKVRGTFILHFAESDPSFKTTEPLQAEVVDGKWTSADGKVTYPVHLQMEQTCPAPGQSRYAIAGAKNDETVEKNAQAFYSAVLAGNAGKAAQYVSYPCSYFPGGKRTTIPNSAEFVKLYAQIFTPEFVAQIAKGTPHHMFANAQGIMIADGKVWFDDQGKAQHLNNESPAQ